MSLPRFMLLDVQSGPWPMIDESGQHCLLMVTVADCPTATTYQTVVEVRLEDGRPTRIVTARRPDQQHVEDPELRAFVASLDFRQQRDVVRARLDAGMSR